MRCFPETIRIAWFARSLAPRLQTYREVGHCPNWECPDRVAADLVAFLS
jgi:pimeloyl-ACP methyl ester carboxylesterase